ncbi:MAG: outer membrane beta-barrel protein [Nanoarchaeota archaeon]|nr:outer membrane beta-barrel protein [Nanoarchaeota archaeon]
MKRIVAVVMIVVCLLGIVSVANAKLLDVFHPYISAGYAYGWDLKGYGLDAESMASGKEAWGYDLKAGIDLLPYFAIEREYLELKGFKDTTVTNISSYLWIANWAVDYKIMISNLKLRYPFKAKNVKITPVFTLGKGDADMTWKEDYEYKSSFRYIIGSSNGKVSLPCYKTGGGVDVEIKHFRVSLEYSYLDIKNTNGTGKNGNIVSVLMLGVSYKI